MFKSIFCKHEEYEKWGNGERLNWYMGHYEIFPKCKIVFEPHEHCTKCGKFKKVTM